MTAAPMNLTREEGKALMGRWVEERRARRARSAQLLALAMNDEMKRIKAARAK